MIDIKGRNILLLVPRHFDYGDQIEKVLKEKFGAKVCKVYENIDQVSPVFNIRYKYLKQDVSEISTRHYLKEIDLSIKFDIVLMIRASFVTNELLDTLKEKNPDAKFILYQWDSTINNPNAVKIYKKFDSVFTFDYPDAKKYGWTYRPLFYNSDYVEKKERKYDIAYACTIHSNRLKIYKELKEMASKYDLSCFNYLYATKLSAIRHSYFVNDPEFRSVKNEVKTKSLSSEEVNRIYNETKIILDYTHPTQNGLTMRTAESVGHRCKLITNNKYAYETDFYNDSNVFVYEKSLDEVPEEFIRSPYVDLDEGVYRHYSIEGFLETVLSAFDDE